MAKELKLSDQVIGQIRELLQLSLLTGTNFVDHCRTLRVEESEKTDGALVLSADYVKGWNAMAEKFHEDAQEKATQMAETLAGDGPEEEEVLISYDPEKKKLVGTRQKN